MSFAKKTCIATAIVSLLATVGANAQMNVSPPEGLVPDAATAIKVAEVILVRFYGQDNTNLEKPLTATNKDGVWIVKGTMPQGFLGGIAEIHIGKKDGRILHLSHDS